MALLRSAVIAPRRGCRCARAAQHIRARHRGRTASAADPLLRNAFSTVEVARKPASSETPAVTVGASLCPQFHWARGIDERRGDSPRSRQIGVCPLSPVAVEVLCESERRALPEDSVAEMRLARVRRGLEAFELDALPQAREQRDSVAEEHWCDVEVDLVDEPEP